MPLRQAILKILFICLFAFTCAVAEAQWTPLNPPAAEANVLAYIEYGSKKYISTANGFYESDSAAGRWTLLGPWSFRQWAMKGDSLLFQDSQSRIGVIRLAGQARLIAPAMNGGFDFNSLMAYGGKIFMAHYRGGFYAVNETSKDFFLMNTGLPADTIIFCHDCGKTVIHPVLRAVRCGSWFIAQTNHGLYKASVSSVIWRPVGGQGTTFQSAYLYASGNDLYAVKDNLVWLSSDLGVTWTSLSAPGGQTILNLYRIDDTLYAGTLNNGVFAKTTGQPNWISFSGGLSCQQVNFVSRTFGGPVCGTTTGGFHYWANGHWQQNNAGQFTSTDFTGMAIHNNRIFTWNSSKLYVTADQGGNWTQTGTAFSSFGILTTASVGQAFFVLCNAGLRLFRTTDGGATWTDLSSKIPVHPMWADELRLTTAGNRLFITYGFGRQMYYSTDLGSTWISVGLTEPLSNNLSDMVVYHSAVYAVFFGDGQVAKLVDDQWVLTGNGLPADREPSYLYTCNDRLYCETDYYGWYIYDEANSSWSHIQTALNREFPDYTYPWSPYRFGSHDFYYAYHKGWVYSDDCLGTLKMVGTEGLLATQPFWPMAFINDTLFVVQGTNGIWKRPLSQITSVPDVAIESGDFRIYPNPASNMLMVNGFPENQEAVVSVYDLTGRRLILKACYPDEQVDISFLDPGIYLIALRSGGRSAVKKLIISR
jgi:hypothetical protein